MNLHGTPDVFTELIQATAEKYSIPEVYVEKDYWVTTALKRLSESAYADQIVFKGGTSLSKAHRLIRRFSEDIDLAAKCTDLSQSKTKALLKETEAAMTVDFDYQQEHPRESKGSKIRKTVHAYPTEHGDEDYGQVTNKILLELNAFTTPEPSQVMPVSTLLHDLLKDIGHDELVDEYSLAPFTLHVLSVERTLCEKVMGLVRACHEEDATAAMRRNIRHFYDICMILRREAHAAFVQSEAFGALMEEVRRADRSLFKDAERWLATPAHDALIFSKPSELWHTLSSEFQGNFRQMLYDDDVPNDNEGIGALQLIGQQLSEMPNRR